jgi:hypothetical protein
VFWILQRAAERGYTDPEIRRAWKQFLYRKWQTAEIRVTELRAWINKALRAARSILKRHQQDNGEAPWEHPRDMPSSEFLKLFGKWTPSDKPSAEAEVRGKAQSAQGEAPPAELRPQQPDADGKEPTRSRPPPQGELGATQRSGHERAAPHHGPEEGRKEASITQDPELLLLKDQWTVEERSADGHCLYHALLGNDDMESMRTLRVRVASWLEAFQKTVFGAMLLQNWVLASAGRTDLISEGSATQRDTAAQEYLQKVKCSGYGGALEIFAFTHVTGLTVNVYQENQLGYALVHNCPGSGKGEPRRLLRVPEGVGHYNEIRRTAPENAQSEAEESIDCRDSQGGNQESPQESQSQRGSPTETAQQSNQRKRARPEAEEADEEILPPRKDASLARLWNSGRPPAKDAQKRGRRHRKAGPRSHGKHAETKGPASTGIAGPPPKGQQGPRDQQRAHVASARGSEARSNPETADESTGTAEEQQESAERGGAKAGDAAEAGDEQEACLWSPPAQENDRVRSQRILREEEEDQRMMAVDEWRSEIYRIKLAEREAWEMARRSEKRREITRRATLLREEPEGRADIMDQWRSDWNHLREQQEDGLTSLRALENRMGKKKTEEKLGRLREALTRSYYEALNLQPGASTTAIRAAGRRTALECHPDKCPGNETVATEVFKAVRHAQEVLEDPAKRKAYDSRQSAPSRRREETSREGAEPPFEEGSIPVYTLAGRVGGDPWALELEELQIRQERTYLGVYENPSSLGECWVLMPGCVVTRARVHGYLFARGGAYAAVVQLDGDTVAISLLLNGRVFATEAAARKVQGAAQRK